MRRSVRRSLVDLALYPHLEDPEMDDTRIAAIRSWARDVPRVTRAAAA